MKVVVTGGAGFIGSHIADAFVERGDEVIVIDDLSFGDRANLNPGAAFFEIDVRGPQAPALLRRERPDVVVHHAGQMSVSESVRDPVHDADVNIMGGLNLLSAVVDAGSRFLFASTGGALYGDADTLPTPETAPAWPVSPYGVSKLAFEHYLHCFRAQHGLDFVVLRYANVYGPRQNPHGEAGVVAIFCQKLFGGDQPVINGDGLNTRDYVNVEDVVRANLAAAAADGCGHYNVGTGRQTTVNHLFELIVELSGMAADQRHGPPRPGDQRTSALDCSLIERELGWRPEVELEEGLERTVAWFKARA